MNEPALEFPAIEPKVGAVRFFQDNLWHVVNPKARQYKDYLHIATQWWDGRAWEEITGTVAMELQSA